MLSIVLVVLFLGVSPLMAWGTLPWEKTPAVDLSKDLSMESQDAQETTAKVAEDTSKTPSASSVVTMTKEDYDKVIEEAKSAFNDGKKSSELYEKTIDTLTTAYTGLSEDYDKVSKELKTVKPYVGFNTSYAFGKNLGIGIDVGVVIKNNLLLTLGFEKRNVFTWEDWKDIHSYSVELNCGWIF